MSSNDQLYSSPDFQQFFKGSLRSLVIKANSPDFTILAASDLYLSLTHRKREEVLNKGLFQVYPGASSDPDEKNSVFSSFMRVIESKERDELPIFKYEIQIGDTGTFETHYWTNVNEPIPGQDGRVAYIINTTTNITDKIRQRDAVEESESRFRLMAEGTDVMIAVSDETGDAVYFNSAWETATGRPVEELLKFGWADSIHPEDRTDVINIFNAAFEKKEPWTWEFRIPSGDEYRWFMARGIPRFSREGRFAGYISSTVDIHQQKLYQATLALLNEDLYSINEELTGMNEELRSAQQELTQTNADLANSEQNLFSSNTRLEESEHLLNLAMESSGLGTWMADLLNRRLVLSVRGNEILAIPEHQALNLDDFIAMIDPADKANVSDAVRAAINYDGKILTECKINTYLNKQPKWLRVTGLIQKNSSGVPIRILGTLQDMTEQRLNDQRKNDFISMVSHELKTPLTSINAYVQILAQRAEKEVNISAQSLLDKTTKQVGKMTTLINGFLNVSRLESAQIHVERTKFNMAMLIAEVEDESLASITTHKVTFAPVEDTMVLLDRDKIGQVLNNLINNAVKYSPSGTTINVACISKGNYVIVSVRDEGYGISAENLPKLFERYYRVQGARQGIPGFGIGLYLCYEIIKRHDGDIWAESVTGKGSTFYFTLPLLLS